MYPSTAGHTHIPGVVAIIYNGPWIIGPAAAGRPLKNIPSVSSVGSRPDVAILLLLQLRNLEGYVERKSKARPRFAVYKYHFSNLNLMA